MRLGMFVIAAILVSVPAVAETDLHAERRTLYALSHAAPDWCPDIDVGWFVRGSIGYDIQASEHELKLLRIAEKKWLDAFREAGPRAVVCEAIMQEWGPGAEFEMFQWK